MDLKSKIRIIEDFPTEGVKFKDITTLLADGEAFKWTIDKIVSNLKDKNITKIAGPEARGFLFGNSVAYAMGLPFIPIRKPGKLPAETISYEYDLEYGTDILEIHRDSIEKGDRIALVDDLLGTGGTMKACCEMLESLGAEIAALEFVIELSYLNGRDKIEGYDINSLVKYD